MRSGDKKIDPTRTYVLEETAITKAMSIEELAELAARTAEPPAEPKPQPKPTPDSRADELEDWTRLLD